MAVVASLLREAELSLLNAPFDPAGWRQATKLAAAATGCHSANLIGLGGPALVPFNIFTGPRNDEFERYFTDPDLWGESNWRVNSTTRPMRIEHEEHYRAYRATASTRS